MKFFKFKKNKWAILSIIVSIVLLIMSIVNNKPFNFGDYVITNVAMQVVIFYFARYKDKDDNKQ
jgi:hypothetical protein